MPTQSTLTPDDKSKVKSIVPKSANKIHAASLARIYFAYPRPNQWTYSGLQGALVFAKDYAKDALYFKMVDLEGTRGVIWEHELYEDFQYYQDRAWFHSFPGDVRHFCIRWCLFR
jgi:hypothetical protein